MKYTEEEIINKFSKVDFDKTGLKKQAIYSRVKQACAPRRISMTKKYTTLLATAVVLLVAVPALLVTLRLGKTARPALAAKPTPAATSEVLTVASVPADKQPQAAPQQPAAQQPPAPLPPVPAEAKPARRPFTLEETALVQTNNLTTDAAVANNTTYGATRGTRIRTMALSAGAAPRAAMAFKGGALPAVAMVMQEAAPISQDSQGYNENGFKKAALEPLSTFSADVDTASYTLLKEQINRGWTVQKEAVRTEALINNFTYDYPAPQGADPVRISIEYATAPWNANNRLVKIGVKAKELDRTNLPQSNLVFLMDVSGSMSGANRLPLAKQAFKMLLEQLDKNDVVSIVTYASGVDVKLDGVKVKDKQKIIDALNSLRAGGATSGEEGLKRAYETAKKHFIRKGNNRIIIASDGDFNVGSSTTQALEKQVSDAKESGVFISALGFGMGNYRDHMMETIADKGNGNYAYINDLQAAQKALVREFGGTLFTVAKDVKFQVEFNPAVVEEYRLIGYEKRLLNNEDFNDDTKDAGDVGCGHSVTVLYEIRPKNGAEKMDIDPLKYTQAQHPNTREVLSVKMRYKDPDGDTSKLLSQTLDADTLKPFEQASADMRFAAAAAAFGQLLRDGQFLNGFTAEQIANTASGAKGTDENGERAEFVQLVRTYAATPQPAPQDENPPVYRPHGKRSDPAPDILWSK